MDELTYLRRRAAQEDCAAKMSCSVEAGMIHRELSVRYARKALALLLAEAENDDDSGQKVAHFTEMKKASGSRAHYFSRP